MKTIALPQWPRMLSLSLGTLMVFYLLLANFFRPFLPLRSEDFPLPFLLFLCSLFFLLLLYSSGRILLPSLFRPGVSFFSHALFLSLVDLWRNSPSRVYSSLESFLPPWAPRQRFLWSIIEKKSPGDLRTPFQRKIYALFFFLPSSLPPLSLGLEYYLRGEVNYFYYGLFLLWFPLIYRFLVFSLQDYCSRHKAQLEKSFTISILEGRGFEFTFRQGYQEDPSLVHRWYLLHRFHSQIYSLERYQLQFSPYLLFLRSLLYFLSWTLVLLHHPSFPSLLP